MDLATGSLELSTEDITDEGCIPIPNGVWEETVLIYVSSSIWHLKCHWMLVKDGYTSFVLWVTRMFLILIILFPVKTK